ncbi:MAG: hypothetical protein ISP54_03630, partial [Flavobacteriales bacterium]|nr:hypothetical protein [Flavobacteriales bacterium]
MIPIVRLCLPACLLFLFSTHLLAQDVQLHVTIEGLTEGAPATLTAERGVGGLFDATVVGQGES